MNSTSIPGLTARIFSATSRPSMCGMTTSVTSRWISPGHSAAMARASGPLAAVITWYPLWVKIRLVTSRSAASSSTTRTVSPLGVRWYGAGSAGGVAASAVTGRVMAKVVPAPGSE
jgi:hypothetical protein